MLRWVVVLLLRWVVLLLLLLWWMLLLLWWMLLLLPWPLARPLRLLLLLQSTQPRRVDADIHIRRGLDLPLKRGAELRHGATQALFGRACPQESSSLARDAVVQTGLLPSVG